MNPQFEIGILFRNNLDLVSPCLWAIRKCTRTSYRLIAVDQGSSDETLDELKLHLGKFESSTLIRNTGIHSVSHGRNLILEARDPSLPLVLMDSDVIVSKERSLENLVYLAGDNAGGVYGRMLSGRFRDPDLRPDPENGFAFVLLTPEALKRVPRFDERFEMFCDDSWFTDQLVASGMFFLSCSDCVGVHYWGSTIRTGSEAVRSVDVDRSDFAAYRASKGESAIRREGIKVCSELDGCSALRLHNNNVLVSNQETQWLCWKASQCQGNILEIGCNRGFTTRELALHNPAKLVFAIDFLGKTICEQQTCEVPDLEMIATSARGMTNVFVSIQNSRTFEYTGKNIGFVFVDGDHSYEGVKADTELAISHQRISGSRMTIAWHDYSHDEPESSGSWLGVTRYLRELSTNGLPIKHISGTVLAYLDL